MNIVNFDYVGNNRKIKKQGINGKMPDFIDRGNKKIIEIFGNYYHSKKITGLSEQQHEKLRKKHFEDAGYQTLVVWEDELEQSNRNILQEKISTFNNIHLSKQ